MRVLQVAAQELGVLHADLVQAVAERCGVRGDAGQVCADALIVGVDALAPLRCAVPVRQAGTL